MDTTGCLLVRRLSDRTQPAVATVTCRVSGLRITVFLALQERWRSATLAPWPQRTSSTPWVGPSPTTSQQAALDMNAALLSGLLAYGDAPSPAVRAHILLTGIQTDPLSLATDALEIVAVIWYLAGVRRLARRGRRWSPYATSAYVAGVAALWVAVGSGLAAYDEVNVTLHVIQHLLLMMVAPPLIGLGKPITLASQASPRRVQVGLLKIVHNHVLTVLTFPVVAWFVYYGIMYSYFEDRGIYDYSISHQLFHDATHLIFFVGGYLYWSAIVGTDPTRWRLPISLRAASVFFGMPFEAFLGISVSDYLTPIDPINTLANTHAADEMFWAGAMFVSALCLASIGVQWFHQLDRETRQEDRRVQAQAATARARAEGLGVKDLREGWTVPWWRLAELQAQQHQNPPQPETER
jgi:putative membrane protein